MRPVGENPHACGKLNSLLNLKTTRSIKYIIMANENVIFYEYFFGAIY